MSRWVIDPNAVDDYKFDWTGWLQQGETITAQTVTADDAGITVTLVSQTAGVVSYRVSAGTVNTDQRVTCHVTTSSGRQDDQTDTFMVRDR